MNPQPTLIEEDQGSDLSKPTRLSGSLTTEQLCERLEKRCVLISNGGGAYLLTSTPDQDCAEAATTLRAQAAEIERLKAESHELTKGLTGLTCGGSEFFIRRGDRYIADIPACVEWVRRRDTAAHEHSIRVVKDNSALTARVEALEGLLTRVDDEFGCTLDQYHKVGPDFTHNDGTEVFEVSVILDRAELIEEVRAALQGVG